jgi:hypothetical protein
VVKSSRGPQRPAKHFQPEDHSHAAHQQQARRRVVRRPGHDVESDRDQHQTQTGHPVEQTPRGPKKGQ